MSPPRGLNGNTSADIVYNCLFHFLMCFDLADGNACREQKGCVLANCLFHIAYVSQLEGMPD